MKFEYKSVSNNTEDKKHIHSWFAMACTYLFAFFAIFFMGIAYNDALYNCPVDFFRCGSHCYYLSTVAAKWKDAYYKCNENNGSTLAKPNNPSQDRSLRACLQKQFIPQEEKWIDGTYNWKQKQWTWGTTGEPMTYHSFSRARPNEFLQWSCAVLNPQLSHKWSMRNCIDKKLYICQTSLITPSQL